MCKSCCGSNCCISFSIFYYWFGVQMTARAVMISRVTASGSGMCGVLLSLAFFLGPFSSFNWTLFFISIDSFFLSFPFLLRTNQDGWNLISSNYHMTWSALDLLLARRTSLSTLVIFLIILPFHSLLTTFQVCISLLFDLFQSHCFGWNRSRVV